MKTLKLQAKDFKEVNGYKEYIGKEDLSNFDGNLEFEANLGLIKVSSIEVTGYISIKAGDWIKAGGSIKAGGWIEADGWIKAGTSIKAIRGGVTAGLQITCTGLLKFKLRLFAGTSPDSWDENCSKEVRCGKLEGNVVYGDVIETGLPDEEIATEEKEVIELNGKKYQLIEENK